MKPPLGIFEPPVAEILVTINLLSDSKPLKDVSLFLLTPKSFDTLFARVDLIGAMYQASLSPVIIKLTCVAATPAKFPVPTASVSPFDPNTSGYAGSSKIVSPA